MIQASPPTPKVSLPLSRWARSSWSYWLLLDALRVSNLRTLLNYCLHGLPFVALASVNFTFLYFFIILWSWMVIISLIVRFICCSWLLVRLTVFTWLLASVFDDNRFSRGCCLLEMYKPLLYLRWYHCPDFTWKTSQLEGSVIPFIMIAFFSSSVIIALSRSLSSTLTFTQLDGILLQIKKCFFRWLLITIIFNIF